LPAFGWSWHVVHAPTNTSGKGGVNGLPTAPFKPATPEILIGRVLKSGSPRATARRSSSRLFAHAV
jgi:hypothetical protein